MAVEIILSIVLLTVFTMVLYYRVSFVKMPSSQDKEWTLEELQKYDGSDPSLPVYLSIKGHVFDVSKSRSMYSPPAGYSCFAGKDASKALGKSSLKPEDCVSDISELSEEELKTLDQWFAHYQKKYQLVGLLRQ